MGRLNVLDIQLRETKSFPREDDRAEETRSPVSRTLHRTAQTLQHAGRAYLTARYTPRVPRHTLALTCSSSSPARPFKLTENDGWSLPRVASVISIARRYKGSASSYLPCGVRARVTQQQVHREDRTSQCVRDPVEPRHIRGTRWWEGQREIDSIQFPEQKESPTFTCTTPR